MSEDAQKTRGQVTEVRDWGPLHERVRAAKESLELLGSLVPDMTITDVIVLAEYLRCGHRDTAAPKGAR